MWAFPAHVLCYAYYYIKTSDTASYIYPPRLGLFLGRKGMPYPKPNAAKSVSVSNPVEFTVQFFRSFFVAVVLYLV